MEAKITKTVGYLAGTDPLFLTRLTLEGIYTLPLGNGLDNHGKYVGLVNKSDGIQVIVGYFHKFVVIDPEKKIPSNHFYTCDLHGIPLVVITPPEKTEEAKQYIRQFYSGDLYCVAPENLWSTVMSILNKASPKEKC